MNARALPAAAPRGKEFAIARFELPIGSDVPIVLPARYALLVDAKKAKVDIDWRLSPVVILVDKAKPVSSAGACT